MWVNCHNMFDAAAGFGGYKESGYGRDGGKEGEKLDDIFTKYDNCAVHCKA